MSMNERVNALAQAAVVAVNQGRWSEAEQLWQRVLVLEPRHPQALYSLGVHAFKRGQFSEALQHLQSAHAAMPHDPGVLLSIARVFHELGDDAGEHKAIDAALAADQYFLPGLLAKAEHLEYRGRRPAAAAAYGNALKVAPDAPHWPAALRDRLEHARVRVEEHGVALAAFLAERTGQRLSSLCPLEQQRWSEAGAILSGQSQPYVSQCARLHVPRLPAIPFYESADFPWVHELESQTGAIGSELDALLAQRQGDFKPYVAYEPGTPVNQWQELNHSQRWSSYFLWRNAEPVVAHQQRCPQTTQALSAVGMADIDRLCPNAMFSVLAPRTRIPPHTGETNARVIVHLPLVVPENCLYRVGFEQRRWEVGKVLIFDDTIEHEARNDSDELRVVLIFDVWNPLLSAGERDMVMAVSAAAREFHRQA